MKPFWGRRRRRRPPPSPPPTDAMSTANKLFQFEFIPGTMMIWMLVKMLMTIAVLFLKDLLWFWKSAGRAVTMFCTMYAILTYTKQIQSAWNCYQMKMQLSTCLISDSCGFSVGDQPLRSTRQASASFPPLQNYHWCDVGKLRSVEKSPMLGNIFRLSLMDDSSWVYVFSHLKNQPVCSVGKSYVGTPQGDFIFLQEFANFPSFRLEILQYYRLLLFLTSQWVAVHVGLTVKVTTTMDACVMAWWWTYWCQRCWRGWWARWSGSCIPELQNREVLGNAARRNFSL